MRRTQAERSGATTAQLLDAARELFGRDGYAATSIDAVAAEAGMTKGAAYHHFPGKAGLFRAVFVVQQERMAAALEAAAAAEPDPRAALRAGCLTFLERCLDPDFRRIVLLDGPSVLGWETVRAIEYAHTLRVLRAGMTVLHEPDGDGDLTARCQLAFGALCEAGMMLARSDDPARALPVVAAEAERLLGLGR
ncbi:TetR/AcrR family transcriptional regulator [Streptomyces beijiangensis]|uniref:TetR/AcrR family transcriptional regulator n=1 Tax=Streptomyces beijiangensis TaxID=163361 RepID=A0A939FB70_9ACTN|nr:TetR/AcrR family transcriptional regulator [Streptomyces beijiangensis]MBO0515392.1 TetR/AcrR family transcriptional regulator [Streptomyces beijiangensis]